MAKEIILYGGCFDPPGIHHCIVLSALRQIHKQSMIVVVPCGKRMDKANIHVDPQHLMEMARLTFGSLEKFGIFLDLFDLENDCFTPTHELVGRYQEQGEIWNFVGADIIAGGAEGVSKIHKDWARGKQDFNELNFIVGHRDGVDWTENDLPSRSRVIHVRSTGNSTAIRKLCGKNERYDHLVLPAIGAYIEENKLYR